MGNRGFGVLGVKFCVYRETTMIKDLTPRFGALTALLPYLKGTETKEEIEKIIDDYLSNKRIYIQEGKISG